VPYLLFNIKVLQLSLVWTFLLRYLLKLVTVIYFWTVFNICTFCLLAEMTLWVHGLKLDGMVQWLLSLYLVGTACTQWKIRGSF